MWDHHFPDKPIERVYNWSPKDWRTAPGYNLKDQTDCVSRFKLPFLVGINKVEQAKKNNMVTIVQGVVDLSKGIERNVTEIALGELVKKRKQKNEKPLKE